MGYWVHIQVSFECQGYDNVSRLAKHHLPLLPEEYIYNDAIRFLKDLSERSGDAPGTKCGLCLWGHVGNYTSAKGFVEILRPFWQELLYDPTTEEEWENWDGPYSHEHILVFYQEEDKDANAYEIYKAEPQHTELVIVHHEKLPFKWS